MSYISVYTIFCFATDTKIKKKNDKHTHEYDKQWKHNCVESVN